MTGADVLWGLAYALGAIGLCALIHEVVTAWGKTSQNEDWTV